MWTKVQLHQYTHSIFLQMYSMNNIAIRQRVHSGLPPLQTTAIKQFVWIDSMLIMGLMQLVDVGVLQVSIIHVSAWVHLHQRTQPTAAMGYYPRPVLVFRYCHCLCLCVCPCVCINHLLVRTITHRPFKLESSNLDQRYKTSWLRSL